MLAASTGQHENSSAALSRTFCPLQVSTLTLFTNCIGFKSSSDRFTVNKRTGGDMDGSGKVHLFVFLEDKNMKV
jgi:hypothetical protein